jgi:hypothetical protein
MQFRIQYTLYIISHICNCVCIYFVYICFVPSNDVIGFGFIELISYNRTCGLPATAKNCLSGVISRRFTC